VESERVHIWVSSCNFSCNNKYLIIVTQLYEKKQKYQSKINVYETHSDTKVCEIGNKSIAEMIETKKRPKNIIPNVLDFNVIGISPHPFIDELVCIYGSGGNIVLLNVRQAVDVWKVRETGLVRKHPLRPVSVDACEFTPDGRCAVAVTIFGTISLYSVPGRLPACDLAPVE